MMTNSAQNSQKSIFLVRHGLSDFNAQGRMQGSSDESLLSDAGKHTASEVGRYLKRIAIHSAVSSSLVRVRQTAEIVLSRVEHKPVLEFDYELRETDLYQWEGQKLSAISRERPDEFHAFKYDPANFSLEHNGQSVFPIRELYHRAGKFWQKNVTRFVQGNNLVVSHGGTIQALINTALGLGPGAHHAFQPSNCGISCLEVGETEEGHAGCFVLKQLNNTVPLGEKLPKLKAGKEGVRVLYYPVEGLLSGEDMVALSELCMIDVIFRHTSVTVDTDFIAAGLRSREFDLKSDEIDSAVRRFAGKGKPFKTYLVVAPADDIRMRLKTISDVSEAFVSRMILQFRTLTVVHHVYSHPVPILQCVNIPVSHES